MQEIRNKCICGIFVRRYRLNGIKKVEELR